MATPKRTIAKILRNAANLIETNGWTQHTLRSVDKFCAIGAIDHVTRGRPNEFSDYKDSSIAMMRHLCIYSIPTWNDSACRTKTEVIRAMRGAARAAEHGLKLR